MPKKTNSKKIITTVKNSKMVLKTPFNTDFTVRRIKAAQDFEINGVKIKAGTLGGLVDVSIPDSFLNEIKIFPGKNSIIAGEENIIVEPLYIPENVYAFLINCFIDAKINFNTFIKEDENVTLDSVPYVIETEFYSTDTITLYLDKNVKFFNSVVKDSAVISLQEGSIVADSIFSGNSYLESRYSVISESALLNYAIVDNIGKSETEMFPLLKSKIGGKSMVKNSSIISSNIGMNACVMNSAVTNKSLIGGNTVLETTIANNVILINNKEYHKKEIDPTMEVAKEYYAYWPEDIFNSIVETEGDEVLNVFYRVQSSFVYNSNRTVSEFKEFLYIGAEKIAQEQKRMGTLHIEEMDEYEDEDEDFFN